MIVYNYEASQGKICTTVTLTRPTPDLATTDRTLIVTGILIWPKIAVFVGSVWRCDTVKAIPHQHQN